MGRILNILFFMTIALFASYEPKVSVTTNRDKIKNGKEFRFKITVRAPKGSKIVFPRMKRVRGYLIKKVENKQFSVRLPSGKEIIKAHKRYTLYPSRSFTLPSFRVKVNNKYYRTESRKITVVRDEKKREKRKEKPKKTLPKETKKVEKRSLEPKTVEKTVNNVEKIEPKKIEEPKVEKRVEDKTPELNVGGNKIAAVPDVMSAQGATPPTPAVDSNNKENSVAEAQQKNMSGSDFEFKLTLNKKKAYVKEAILATVELSQPIDLQIADEPEYLAPKFEGFKVSPVEYIETIKKGNKIITRIDYSLRPIKSGTLRVDSALVKINVDLIPQVEGPFNFFGREIQSKTLTTKPVYVEVKPLPEDVKLVGQYKMKISSKKEAKANEPFIVELQLHGKGDLEGIKLQEIDSNIPFLESKEDNFERRIVKNTIYTRVIKRYTIRPTSDFTIPALKLKAFNPKNIKLYTVSTEPVSIKVKNSKAKSSGDGNISKKAVVATAATAAGLAGATIATQNQDDVVAVQNSNRTQQNLEEQELSFDIEYYKRKLEEIESENISKAFIFIVGFILGVLLAIAYKPIMKKIKTRGEKSRLYTSYSEALGILYPHTTESEDIEIMVKLLYEVVNGNYEVKIDNKKLDKLVEKVLNKD